MMESPMLKLENINLSYGEAEVLFGISLEVRQGEIVALLGSNGAGKSSTLKAISGLAHVSSGRVLFEGEDVTNYPSSALVSRGLSHTPEGRRLFPRMSVEENLMLGSRKRTKPAKMRELLQQSFEMFPVLKERRKQMVGLMSGGEQQQCAIARTLMAEPRFVLMDEPSLGLAPQIISDVFRVIRQIREAGVTILLVEQNMVQSLAIADRAYVLERGEVTISGDAKVLANDPALQRAYLGA